MHSNRLERLTSFATHAGRKAVRYGAGRLWVERRYEGALPRLPLSRALLRSIPNLYGETRVTLPVISGALPHPFSRPAGCPFHPRCPEAMERCSAAVPSLQPVTPNQLASCFLHHDQAEPT